MRAWEDVEIKTADRLDRRCDRDRQRCELQENQRANDHSCDAELDVGLEIVAFDERGRKSECEKAPEPKSLAFSMGLSNESGRNC